MNLIRLALFAFLVFSLPGVNCQDTLKLGEALNLAVKNYPTLQGMTTLEKIEKNQIHILSSSWLPELTLNGMASYQSDVVEISPEIQGLSFDFPSAPKDQYKIYMEVNQKIFDGGVTKHKKELTNSNSDLLKIQLEINADRVKEEILELYFGILELQLNEKVIRLNIELLEENIRLGKSSLEQGILLPSDIDLLEVELLKANQQLTEMTNKRLLYSNILKERTGLKTDVELILDESDFYTDSDSISRKELDLYDLHISELDLSRELKKTARMPFIYAFGQVGYGNPGLNFLNDNFDSYYVVGAGVKWNIWNWGKTQDELENLKLQSELIRDNRNEFLQNLELSIMKQEEYLSSKRENLRELEKIHSLRRKISETYQSQLENGIIKTIDYVSVLNQEKLAHLELNHTRIQLQKGLAFMKLLKGKL